MITLGDIIRQHAPAYRAHYGQHMLPSQHAALHAMEQCRTEALGGHIYRCDACQTSHYSYHSCRNRHCPSCQHRDTQAWLAAQHDLLLPVPYFLVTFTLPAELRDVTYRHQRTLYNLLFRTSATALMQLARDPRFLGAQLGMMGVLQTWTRDLRYHPHVHYLVPGGGLDDNGNWVAARTDFLVHVKALAALFQGKMRAALRQSGLWSEIPAAAWEQAWVVDCRPVGNGATALRYLAPYIFRVAISNKRLVRVTEEQVTFRYQIGATGQIAYCTLGVLAFVQRLLQHVLPKGFVKVRYYGLFRVGNRRCLARLRRQLYAQGRVALPVMAVAPAGKDEVRCPMCGQVMRVERLERAHNRGPPGATHSQKQE